MPGWWCRCSCAYHLQCRWPWGDNRTCCLCPSPLDITTCWIRDGTEWCTSELWHASYCETAAGSIPVAAGKSSDRIDQKPSPLPSKSCPITWTWSHPPPCSSSHEGLPWYTEGMWTCIAFCRVITSVSCSLLKLFHFVPSYTQCWFNWILSSMIVR